MHFDNSEPLSTYLRMYRLRTGLSQRDVAYLLGAIDGSNVCRHERIGRAPVLGTLLEYEFIYGRPSGELFEGAKYRRAADVILRAKGLSMLLRRQRACSSRDAKLRFLARLIEEFEGDIID